MNLNKNGGAEEDLEEVVADEELPDVERLPVLHVVGTPDLDDEDVGQADEQGRQRT